MKINKSDFVKSSAKYKECPLGDKPEYAFIGRSNVGKSSLINMLTGRKGLAKISETPGKTQLINHFLIDDSWFLVDLPGLGYAKVSKVKRYEFGKLVSDYLMKRENLICVFMLVDSRHEPQKIDMEFMAWMGMNGIPFAMVFTKLDKLKPQEKTDNIERYNKIMLETWEELPPQFSTSSVDKDGKEELLEYIAKLNVESNP